MNTASTDPWARLACAAFALSMGCSQEYDVITGPVNVDPADVLECPFSPLSDTKLSVYDCNPVFSGTDEEWGEGFISVGFRTQTVLGHPFYQIWYTSNPGVARGDYGLGYAVSGDGTNWVAHEANPLVEEDGGWDKDNMDQVVVVWDESQSEYVLAYQGYNLDNNRWGLGMLQSKDGVDWTAFNDGNMVLDFTSEANSGVTYCWPVGFNWEESKGFFGYLGGTHNTRNVCQIYGFEGQALEDGFELGSEPILRAGPESYDNAGMASASTVFYDGTWYMFYVGFEDWQQGNGYQSTLRHSLNLATSTDGITWEKHADNPLPVALTQPGAIGDVAAQVVGSRIHLWITDWYEDIDQSAVGYYLYEPDADLHP